MTNVTACTAGDDGHDSVTFVDVSPAVTSTVDTPVTSHGLPEYADDFVTDAAGAAAIAAGVSSSDPPSA